MESIRKCHFAFFPPRYSFINILTLLSGMFLTSFGNGVWMEESQISSRDILQKPTRTIQSYRASSPRGIPIRAKDSTPYYSKSTKLNTWRSHSTHTPSSSSKESFPGWRLKLRRRGWGWNRFPIQSDNSDAMLVADIWFSGYGDHHKNPAECENLAKFSWYLTGGCAY